MSAEHFECDGSTGCGCLPSGEVWASAVTLRDLFALAALRSPCNRCGGWFGDVAAGAKACYQIADAMMEARKAKP